MVTVILAHIFLAAESLTPLKLVGVIVAFAGAGMLFVRGETGLSALADADWRGYAWTSLGNLGSGGSVVYARRYLRHDKNWDVSSVRMMVAALAMVPITGLTVGYDMSGVTSVGYMGLVYAALIGTWYDEDALPNYASLQACGSTSTWSSVLGPRWHGKLRTSFRWLPPPWARSFSMNKLLLL